MATLYEVSQQARRAMLLLLIFIIVVLVIDNISKFFNAQNTPFSADISCYAAPNDILGVFPEPVIPSLAITEESNPSFLIEGAFPSHPDTVLVYSIERPREKLDTVADAENTARQLGFTNVDLTTTGNELVWENPAKTRSLRFNKINLSWRMRTQYFQDVVALQRKSLLSDTQKYKSEVRALMSKIGFTERSISSGITVTTLSKLGADGLFTAPVAGLGADYVTVDVFRNLTQTRVIPRNSLPEPVKEVCNFEAANSVVFTTDPRVGSLHMVVSDEAKEPSKDIYEIDFIDYEYNYGTVGVKRVVSPDVAWERVRAGEGSLVLLNAQGRDTFANYESVGVTNFSVDASETQISYYEPEVWDGRVYPIYVFRGNAQLADGRLARFTFFVDALTRIDLGT